MYLKKLKIGNVELENNIILAPMAGITDLPFRIICKNFGPGLVYTEMASAKAIYYGDEKTKKLLNIEGEKRPIAVQIFGSDVIAMKAAAKYVSKFADIIDINMGCPAPKVVKNGDGSKLLTNLNLASEIIENVVNAVEVPVTVKIRKGWDDSHIVAVDIAKIAEEKGASAVIVHGRTREEFFSGNVDLEIIKKVKESVAIPVIGNGNIFNEEDAYKMFEYTGSDGIMCGRGTLGNPWLFKSIISYLKTGKKNQLEVSKEEKLEVILKHIDLEIKEKGEYTGIREMRKHISWYIKNMKDATKTRDMINKIEDRKELEACLKEYFRSI